MVILLSYKKNEVLPFMTTWVDLEDIVLSEITPAQKGKCHMILLMWNLKKLIPKN
jgi:hypothetical protein